MSENVARQQHQIEQQHERKYLSALCSSCLIYCSFRTSHVGHFAVRTQMFALYVVTKDYQAAPSSLLALITTNASNISDAFVVTELSLLASAIRLKTDLQKTTQSNFI